MRLYYLKQIQITKLEYWQCIMHRRVRICIMIFLLSTTLSI